MLFALIIKHFGRYLKFIKRKGYIVQCRARGRADREGRMPCGVVLFACLQIETLSE